jgi:ubiquinone/menaquinone biosynthesis C-methylase UbiE
VSALDDRVAQVGYDFAAREMEHVRACNLCGSEAHVEAARRDRYGFPAVYRVCARCGLGFLSPRLTAAEYGRFYENVYRPLVSAYHGRLIDAVTVQAEQRAYADELVGFLGGVLSSPPQTVLDVGGSTGIVAGAVRDAFGSRPTVLDPAPDELAVAAEAGMATVAGFAEDTDLGPATFDLVLLCQTVDHLLDVAGTLAAIRRWVAPGGRLFVDALDVGFMMRRRGTVEGAVKIDHPYYLTRETALAYLAQAGFEVAAERLSADGHWGFVAVPAEPREPDWARLRAAADRHLAELWALRAAG